MKFSLLISLLLISWNVHSQDNNYNIKISPFSLIDEFSFPTVQFGIETKLSQRFTWYNEIGIKYRRSFFEKADTSFIRTSGFKAKSEIRYYLPNSIGVEEIRTVLNGFYLGANLFYIRDYHNSVISYYPNNDSSVIFIDNFAVKKNVFGLNLIFGLQKKLIRHLLIDLYAGFGFRFRIINDSHLEFDSELDHMIKHTDDFIQDYRNKIDVKSGVSNIPGLTLGLRLGYRFRN
jgi:hypothetical protein